MREIIVLAVQIGIETEELNVLQGAGDVRRLHEAEPHLHAIKTVADALDFVTFAERHTRAPLKHEAHQRHPFVKHAIMLEVGR